MTRELDLAGALDALQHGGVVAVPTDTVYGVAASLAHREAVARLFRVKSRPSHVALPVLVGSESDVEGLALTWDEDARRLAERFWPGALTVIVPAPGALASVVGARDSVGVRQPDLAMLTEVLAQTGPLAVTSANEHGRPPCTSVEDVRCASWGDALAGVLDGGSRDAVVSTVVDLSGEGWRIRRLGAVSREALVEVLGPSDADADN